MRLRQTLILLVMLTSAGCASGMYGLSRDVPPPKPEGTVTAAVGKTAGSDIGGAVSRLLTERDRIMIKELTQRGLETGPSGKTLWWKNEQSGNHGTITPQPRFDIGDTGPCREFQQTISAGEETATGYGTACRAGDGKWRLAKGG